MIGHRMMGWGAMPLLFIFLSGSTTEGCNEPQTSKQSPAQTPPPTEQRTQAAPDDQDTSAWHLPYFGFNAKGALDPEKQTQYADAFFDQIPGFIKKNMVVRVNAGTQSQQTFADDWTPAMMKLWADFQKKQGVRFIYVVNGNDTPANQAAMIQRWMDAGASFDFIEMMNEYYLPKYAKGDKSKKEVTDMITPEKYVNTILPDFWKELDKFHLPYYVIFAPSKPGKANADKIMDHWNEVMTDALKNKYPDRQLNATIHLYLKGGTDLGGFDYDQIDRVRKDMPSGRHIAVTEAGVIDPGLSYQQAGETAASHYRNILQHLQPGDYLLDQVLYNAGKNNNTAALNPQTNGETNKGKVILQFIKNRLK
jgi:hypothetical protein